MLFSFPVILLLCIIFSIKFPQAFLYFVFAPIWGAGIGMFMWGSLGMFIGDPFWSLNVYLFFVLCGYIIAVIAVRTLSLLW